VTGLSDYSLELPYVLGQSPDITAYFKSENEDFCVEEHLSVQPDDAGEHVWLKIVKNGENTQFVANELSRFAGVRPFDVGFSGLKDRNAVTTQWFSVWLPFKEKEPNWQAFNQANIHIIEMRRQSKKIRRGDHEKNHFKIRLRDVRQSGADVNADQSLLQPIDEPLKQATLEKIDKLHKLGFPNYFGHQRFGYSGNNLQQGLLLAGKSNKKGKGRRKTTRLSGNQSLYLSAMRSWLFNQIVAGHVHRQFDLTTVKDGTLFGLLTRADEDERAGLDPLSEQGQAFKLEESIFDQYSEMTNVLTEFGLKRDARALRITPEQLNCTFQDGIESDQGLRVDLVLEFDLPPGAYATTFLREWVSLKTE
jgi:tRNA pseudouridine13 synthase